MCVIPSSVLYYSDFRRVLFRAKGKTLGFREEGKRGSVSDVIPTFTRVRQKGDS